MHIRIVDVALGSVEADVLILPVVEGAGVPALDKQLGGVIEAALAAGDLSVGFGQSLLFYSNGAIRARKVLLFNLGKEAKLDGGRLRRAFGMAVRIARQGGAKTVAIAVPQQSTLDIVAVGQFLTEGVLHGLHRHQGFKTERNEKRQVDTVLLVRPASADFQAGVERGRVIGEGTNVARTLTWLPGNHLTATQLAEQAVTIGQEVGIDVQVYDRAGCEALGLGLLLAVNQGSKEEPRFVVMRYKGNGGEGPWLGLVGKGVTFDTGGISIKPTAGMWDMKNDMGGAAAVLGAMYAIGRLKPACDIIAVMACTDNMPDGSAFKPGDVIVGLSGKTVEVRSTDAEGRLVLADGLAYAVQQGCSKLLTASTLTGAAQIAFGPIRFGMVSNDEEWEESVFQGAAEAGERGWKLPHDEEYYDLFKSPIADMANSGVPLQAGTVVGGLFLMRHVGKTPCVHLDIANVVWRSGEDSYEDAGATGVAVKTMVRTAFRFAEETD